MYAIRSYYAKVGYKLTLETIHDDELLAKLSAQRIEWNEDSGKWEIRRWELRKFDGFKEYFSSGEDLDTVINITPKGFDNDWRLFETLRNNFV